METQSEHAAQSRELIEIFDWQPLNGEVIFDKIISLGSINIHLGDSDEVPDVVDEFQVRLNGHHMLVDIHCRLYPDRPDDWYGLIVPKNSVDNY